WPRDHPRTSRAGSGRGRGERSSNDTSDGDAASVGVERGAHGAGCMVESGSDGARRLAERLGDLGGLVSEVVAKDEDRALLRRQPAKGTIELVAMGDARQLGR